ncbi:MAG: hypothetical protein QOC80_379 [Frankiaceae bacterium]|jgi:hypothetical protein|nr:hypothetical protein [Frankiaceae bacterium]MDQ1672228.1 hypothetical protein [Frankiaceae bacterium]
MKRGRRIPVVTTLTAPQRQQMRLHRYLSIMGVAIACFVTSPFLPGPLPYVAILVAAICLPTAAIVANQPMRRIEPGESVTDARRIHPEAPDPEHRIIDPDR